MTADQWFTLLQAIYISMFNLDLYIMLPLWDGKTAVILQFQPNSHIFGVIVPILHSSFTDKGQIWHQTVDQWSLLAYQISSNPFIVLPSPHGTKCSLALYFPPLPLPFLFSIPSLLHMSSCRESVEHSKLPLQLRAVHMTGHRSTIII